MYPHNGQWNTAYNNHVTGQKKTVPLHVNSKNLLKTRSVIVFLKLLKCLHIECATMIYLPIVHVHKFICTGVLRGLASYHHHHYM